MRVLVTGASGFVGQHLTRMLHERGEQVVAWGLAADASECNPLDLMDTDALAQEDLTGIEAVIHLAGLAQVGRSFAEPALYVSSNPVMELNLFEEFLRQGTFPRVLVISSGGVYRGAKTVIDEDSPVDPTSPYVVSKLAQELTAQYYGKRGFDVIVARPFNHIGPGQEPGYLIADVCSQIVTLERKGGGELAVGDLSSSRDYTDVRDVAAAYHSLIHNGHPGETYNICSGRSRSGSEIVELLCGLSTAEINPVQHAALVRPSESRDVKASNAKIHADTGWSVELSLDTTLAETLAYWRSRA